MGDTPSDAADPAERPEQPDERPVPKTPQTSKATEGPAPAFFSPHAAVLAIESAPVLGSEPARPPEPDTPDGGPVSPVVRRSRVRRHRVLIGDARHNGRYVRATWHADGRVFVLSTWADEVCTGAVRVPVHKAPELINLLSDGLADALDPRQVAERKTPSPIEAAQVQMLGLKARILRRLRVAAAQATTSLRAREVSALAKVHEYKRPQPPQS
ncbi:MAG TPA: hypothetical protein VIL36_08635 [Acidimicrobiales bacterium]